MNTEDYIGYYEDVVPDELCCNILNSKFAFQPSTYSTHGSGKVVKDERVRMEDFWIRKDNIFYNDNDSIYGLCFTLGSNELLGSNCNY